MLSEQEKREMFEDGKNPGRRRGFAEMQRQFTKRKNLKHQQLYLDEFIQFLQEIQTIFSPFINSRRKTIIRNSKL